MRSKGGYEFRAIQTYGVNSELELTDLHIAYPFED